MKVRSLQGVEMMDVKSVRRDGDRIFIKGKMMGTMATTLVLTPESVWEAWKIIPLETIVRLPLLLFKGWRLARRHDEKSQAAS